MLGVATNPQLWSADHALKEIAEDLERGDTFRPTEVGVFFGTPGVAVPDPYFAGEGIARAGCIFCGNCMAGCRHNAKNTLVKNYLYFAEKWGAEIRAEALVKNIIPVSNQPDGARYEILYEKSTTWFFKAPSRVRARC